MITDSLLARGLAQGGTSNIDVAYTVPASTTISGFNVHIAGVQGGGTANVVVNNGSNNFFIDKVTIAPGTVYNKTYKMIVPSGSIISVGVTAAILGTCGAHISGKVLT